MLHLDGTGTPTPRSSAHDNCGRANLGAVIEINDIVVRHPDADRVAGATKTVGGKVKEAVGKLTGDQKTVAEGHAEQKVGKVQNAVGGFKDTVRDIQKAK
jgi:uncharacterized protein YjbJ (UPF0337 family)